MRHCWTKKEEDILVSYYSDKGAIGCISLLNRTQKAICKKARKLGLSTKTTFGGVLSGKHVIKQLNKTRGMVMCDKHGYALHYLWNYHSPVCVACRVEYGKKYREKNPVTSSQKLRINQKQRERYKKPIHNYANRLRRTLRFYSHGEISFSQHLPYSASQLCCHLENIRGQQHNCCPMCKVSYDITGYDIDHITPIFTAVNNEEVLQLFNLKNLSLLCPSCNRHIKRDNDISARQEKGGVVRCH